MLTDQIIRDEVALSITYSKGNQYFRLGYVNKLEYNSDMNVFYARVKGGKTYNVRIDFDDGGDIEDYECTCPAYYEYNGACKHIVATLKEIQSRWDEFFSETNDVRLTGNTKVLFDFFNNINSEDASQNIPSIDVNTRIVPIFCFSIVTGKRRKWLEFSVGNDKLYAIKNIRSFIESAVNGNQISCGKNFVFRPVEAVYDEKSKALMNLLKDTFFDEKNISEWGYYTSYNNSAFSEEKKFKLSNSNLLKFFEIMKDETFEISINDKKHKDVRVIEGRPDFKLDINSFCDGIKASLNLDGDVYYGLDADFNYVYHKNIIYKVDSLFASYLTPLMKCFSDSKKPEILIPDTEVQFFFSSIVPAIEKVATVKLDSTLTKTKRFYREDLEKQVYFDKYGSGIAVKVNFKYGEIEINPLDSLANKNSINEGKTLLRETQEENKLIGIFKKYGFKSAKGMYIQKDEEGTYNFLKEGLEEIRELSEVFYSDEFKNISIKNNGKISVGVRVNTETGLLEMDMKYEGVELKELMDLMVSYKLKKKYHRLKTGNFIPLDSSEFQSVAEFIEQLNLSKSDITKKVIELPKYRAMYIDSMAREKTELNIERSSTFKKMVQDLSEPQEMEFELPEGINGKLRDYQKIGYKWLKTLSYYSFGGILADDMGLGKTLQIITLVKSENEVERKPSLVIVPTSLVYNWQEEVKKFAPDLSVTIISGTQADRRERFGEIENSDIVVTSYGMIKRDIELYQDFQFKYCFIDEAQHIKNPNTLNAKAVKRIKAGGYFALTGTPIENTLSELWSIFDFIMPGYLLSHNKFISRFETPIVKNDDKNALKELGRHIKPFVLRRMKKEVLKELPEKIESKMSNEMTSEQRKIYTAYLMKAKKEFEHELLANGFENSRIKILAILMRMRQICCHPALFIENYKGGSGKLEILKELLEDAVGGGHRILVFSQFTSMLALIKKELDAMDIKYHYLDGSTSAEERIQLVNSFNGGEKDVFLISLKAGGTGLNLTGADMVVHFDPWWNPAVEDQATDRAYRIGQKNVVQVFKMITKDTIEEKIFELQQKKKELIDAVIKPGENLLTKMTEEEIRRLFELG